ncbi:MAG: mannitol dehydrogenase family protein [Alphaproteobacteria bacterium]
MTRLSNATLNRLPVSIIKPNYIRSNITIGIVHLGIGAFHRAHQAVYTDDVLASGDHRWGILGASLRSAETRDALSPQDGLYTIAIRNAAGTVHRVIGSVMRLLVAPENPEALIAAMADPHVKIVSLTITEKGYCLDPATGKLDGEHPDIRHDIANPDQPKTAPGYILAALHRRRALGLKPFTVMSCDNLPSNGKKLQAILIKLAGLRSAEFASFIETDVACPSTMIDRIVPQTTDEDRAIAKAALHLEDAWPIATEPFTQWVTEDRFPEGRPDWERFGAELVDNVAPYEAMKLRLLNASHTMLAFLGSLAGYRTVADAMNNKAIGSFIARFMEEDVIPVLTIPPGADVHAYAASLLERFRNPALNHRLEQIASDSSQKIPQRFLGTAQDRLAQGLPLGRLAYALAGFALYVLGRDEAGQTLALKDPMAESLRQSLAAAGDDPEAMINAFLGFTAIFGQWSQDHRFVDPLIHALNALRSHGVRASL